MIEVQNGNTAPLVSVIMGIYNCDDTLGECIDSIIAQTYQNWELIMCDDGSADGTYNLALSYANREPRIKLLKNEKNLTLGPTLNRCLSVADGEFTARMDGDDLSVPDRFEKQVDFLLEHSDIDVVGSFMKIRDGVHDDKVRTAVEFPDIFHLPKGNPCCHATIMMRTAVFKELGGYSSAPEVRRVEDVDLFWRFYESGHKAANILEPLYIVREDANGYIRRKFRFYVNACNAVRRGCRTMKLPLKCRLYAFKPLIVGCIPSGLLRAYHNAKDSKI